MGAKCLNIVTCWILPSMLVHALSSYTPLVVYNIIMLHNQQVTATCFPDILLLLFCLLWSPVYVSNGHRQKKSMTHKNWQRVIWRWPQTSFEIVTLYHPMITLVFLRKSKMCLFNQKIWQTWESNSQVKYAKVIEGSFWWPWTCILLWKDVKAYQ